MKRPVLPVKKLRREAEVERARFPDLTDCGRVWKTSRYTLLQTKSQKSHVCYIEIKPKQGDICPIHPRDSGRDSRAEWRTARLGTASGRKHGVEGVRGWLAQDLLYPRWQKLCRGRRCCQARERCDGDLIKAKGVLHRLLLGQPMVKN